MEEKKIDLMGLLMLAWRRLWVIVLSAIIFAAGAFCYNKFFVTPVYSARASIVVTNGGMTFYEAIQSSDNGKVTASDLSASLYLIETVKDVLKTNDFYENVAKDIARESKKEYKFGDGQGSALKNMTSISQRSENSLFIDITVSNTDPQKAIDYANKIADIGWEYVEDTIPNTKAQAIETAFTYSLIYPQTARSTVIFGVIGAIASYIALFAIESMNRSIKGEEDFASRYDVPLLGAVPDFENAESGGYRKKKGRGGYSSGY